MIGKQYSLQFEKLLCALDLGKTKCFPEEIEGGHLNKMFAVQTEDCRYAVKALNPQIMLRPEAMRNWICSERIAGIAAKNVTAAPALIFNGRTIQEIEGQYYMIFNWIEGKCLKPNEIGIPHCEKIGAILADLHMTDFSEICLNEERPEVYKLTDWNFYLQKGRESNAVWVGLLNESLNDLYAWDAGAAKAASSLAANTIISHRDLDPKNVMWGNDGPVIIDWEAAGLVNQASDLVATAIYWAIDETENINAEKFCALIKAYKKKYGILTADWKTVLIKGFSDKIGWLEYSLKRSLMMECADDDEQRTGTEQTIETIWSMKKYADMMAKLGEWLEDV